MAKVRSIFNCQTCGYQTPKWLGRCPDCQSWNSFLEEAEETTAGKNSSRSQSDIADQGSEPISILDIDAERDPRLVSGMVEFDRVTGGGLVPGSLLLIGGDPGVGKSTLVLQILARLAAGGMDVLYVTGEESVRQIKLRADRLGILEGKLIVAAMNDVDALLKTVKKRKPAVVAVDSIQTVYTSELSSAPGSITQVRESAMRIMGLAKRSGIAAMLIGHVTKDGSLAGPRVLEHMVDCVLNFEGEKGYPFRVLRSTKNRFGSTNEVGVFEMLREGLRQVANPSKLFLAERPVDEPGSVVTVSMEGSRPLLIEVQALVSPTGFGTPRRTCIGVDHNRVALLAAVLEKKAGLDLAGCDIFVNVAGGVRVGEPAVDLGIACALASSLIDRPVASDTLIFGELGLAGEVRFAGQPELRLKEAHKMGFTRAVMPKGSDRKWSVPEGMRIEGVSNIAQAIEVLF